MKNRPRRYVSGHNRRGHGDPRNPDAQLGTRERHARSAALVPDGPCAWLSIGGCGTGRSEVAHVNGDESDNRPSNLLRLCSSHHKLLDRGWIDPAAPVMPPYYVDAGGKRRYGKTKTGRTCQAWLDNRTRRCRLPRGHDEPCGSPTP